MFKHLQTSVLSRFNRQTLTLLIITLLLIEFLDELVFGLRESCWPLIRDELKLTYFEIGLLLSIPTIIGGLIEPLLGIIADSRYRRSLILGGGLLFTLSLFLIAASNSFLLLMIAFIIINPASGSFVSISQLALMDADPTRQEKNMARWAAAGSIGNVLGSLMVSGAMMISLSWHGMFLILALISTVLVSLSFRLPLTYIPSNIEYSNKEFNPDQITEQSNEKIDAQFIKQGINKAWQALQQRAVLRWVVLLICSDMMLDILMGFLALYFVDVVNTTEAEAAFALLVWRVAGLPGDILIIPLLERVRGLSYLWVSAMVVTVLYSLFLLIPALTIKLIILALLGLFNAGWYSILKAQLYSTLPGQSGTVMVLDSLLSIISALIPLTIGVIAGFLGLANAMWLLLIGPLMILISLTRSRD